MAKLILIGTQEFLVIAAKAFLEVGYELLLMIPEEAKPNFDAESLNTLGSVVFFDQIRSDHCHQVAEAFEPDFILSIIFGHRIPDSFCALAKREALNFHPALLPDCRSGNTWFWAIRLGATRTGISIHRLEEKWDAGDILYIHPIPLSPNDTQGFYYERIRNETRACLLHLHRLLCETTLKFQSQPESAYFPRLRHKDILIDWSESGESIANFVRACNPNHFAETWFRNQVIQIIEVSPTQRRRDLAFHPDGTMVVPGELIGDQTSLYCAAGDVFLKLEILAVRERACITGSRVALLFNVKQGERLLNIAEMSEFEPSLMKSL